MEFRRGSQRVGFKSHAPDPSVGMASLGYFGFASVFCAFVLYEPVGYNGLLRLLSFGIFGLRDSQTLYGDGCLTENSAYLYCAL